VPIGVVHGFEMVDIDHGDRHFFRVALGPRQQAVELAHHGGAVQDAGQPVLVGKRSDQKRALAPGADGAEEKPGIIGFTS